MVHGPAKHDLPLKAPAPVPKWAAVHEDSGELDRRAPKTYRPKDQERGRSLSISGLFSGVERVDKYDALQIKTILKIFAQHVPHAGTPG